MATLFVISGPSEGRCYRLGADRLVSVGRDDQCSLQILDERISRRHLQIRHDEQRNRHFAIDMRSANGVLVNGRQITDETLLGENDVIAIGDTKLAYTQQDFPDEASALLHYRKTDEWKKGTTY